MAQQDSYQDKQTTHYAVSQLNGKILGLFTPEGELAWKAEKRTLWGICFDWYQFKYPNPLDPEMLFAGQWLDQESGLAYNRFRYYDPETGNYLCLDPIGLAGGETPYAYVHNPWDWVDLLGLSSCKKNADILRQNMLREGITFQKGDAAAHIVASTGSKGHWQAAARSRELLAQYRVNINDAANGIPLGHPTPHNITHTRAFHEMVNSRLNNVVKSLPKAGARRIRSALRKELRNIGSEVLKSLK
ncbi:hypothetical protein E4T80_12195 [Muribacter muris]|uniref:RHS repeat-associated core domain-containing protein n=1 Tax=Muribacter muris TaxID=67855 RepID=A0A4Y9JNZ3_9PAST|nr:RHS repeat-associated core domain-containing protein [Muribacter muris]MBF0786224.1 AHH domain-containing protein [Muribacter muris]MBF0827061.1 AHH domain-containing protein [Muribacter muris]TFV07494.1 hypothetical protein E4T80_12195 [Muribacter muris]